MIDLVKDDDAQCVLDVVPEVVKRGEREEEKLIQGEAVGVLEMEKQAEEEAPNLNERVA